MAAGPTGQTHLHAFEQDGAEIEAKQHLLVETCLFYNEQTDQE